MPPAKNGPSVLEYGDAKLENARAPGTFITLKELWADKPVAIAFMRRLGCQLCRVSAQDYDKVRPDVEAAGGRFVAVSFERLGEGSDSPPTFEAGKYWTGDLYTLDKDVYEKLFGRKGLLNSFYGLGDMSSKKVADVKARGVTGNYKGDGFVLGGQFVVAKGGASVVLDKRQRFYGDDAEADDMLEAVKKATASS